MEFHQSTEQDFKSPWLLCYFFVGLSPGWWHDMSSGDKRRFRNLQIDQALQVMYLKVGEKIAICHLQIDIDTY